VELNDQEMAERDRIAETFGPDDEDDVVSTDGQAMVEPQEHVTEGAETEPEEEPAILKVVTYIRSESRAVRLVDPDVFTKEPFSLSQEELAEIWATLAEEENASDIVFTEDERDGTRWVHSTAWLSVPYAKTMRAIAANDPVHLVADWVREHSPTSVDFFLTPPFSMQGDEVAAVVGQILADPDLADIKMLQTTDGTFHLFSERTSSEADARAYAQWHEVDARLPQNQ
jgi:hypothetical protein